jgi:hypothetical protein
MQAKKAFNNKSGLESTFLADDRQAVAAPDTAFIFEFLSLPASRHRKRSRFRTRNFARPFHSN